MFFPLYFHNASSDDFRTVLTCRTGTIPALTYAYRYNYYYNITRGLVNFIALANPFLALGFMNTPGVYEFVLRN